MENKSHAFAAGLFAIILLAAGVFAIYWLGGVKEATDDYIIVARQDIGGLNPQAQVRYRGIRVGKVSDIRLDDEDRQNILITISIRRDIRLTRGTVARLNYQGVTGLAHILLLESGGSAEPLAPDGKEPPRIAMTPSLLDEFGNAGSATLREARQVLGKLDALLNAENRARLSATLVNLEAASSGLKPALENLNQTLSQMRKLFDERNVAKLSAAVGDAGPTLADVRAAARKVQAAADKLDAAIGEPPPGGAAALAPRLNDMADDISAAARQLNRLLRLLEETPQGLVFGVPAPPPGPGEPGFSPDKAP